MVDVEIIENNRKKKTRKRLFHGKTNSGWVIHLICKVVLAMCRDM